MKTILWCLSLCMLLSFCANGQTGIGTLSPNSSLDVRGAMATGIRLITSSASLDYFDHIAVFTGTTDASITLPDASGCKGRIYWIKNGSASLPSPVLTVTPSLSQLIDGATNTVLDEPNEIIRLISDGSNWQISAQDVPTAKTSTSGGSWNEGGNSLKTMKYVGTISNLDFPIIANNIEGMHLTTAGYLGVGTNNPQGRVHFVNVNDDNGNDYAMNDYMNGTTITQILYIKKSSGTFASPGNLSNGDTIGQFRFAPRYGGSLTRSNGSGVDAVYKGDGTTALSDLRFFTSNAEQMRINENGKVSIGTTTPDGVNPEKLLVDAGTTGSYNVISGKGEIDNYLQLNIQNKSAGNVASSDLVASADNADESNNYIDMGINSSGYGAGTAPILNGLNQSYLYSTGADFVIGNSTPSQDLVFFTNGYAATNERMRITSSGNIGIGQIAAPSEKLIVGGITTPGLDNAYTLGTTSARWSAVWASNGLIQTSDARLKTNIVALNYGLKELMKLRPVSYQWAKNAKGTKSLGLIAQETKKVIPEVLVGDGKKETLGLNYAELVPLLIRSLQQQQEKLESLKKELSDLEKDNGSEN